MRVLLVAALASVACPTLLAASARDAANPLSKVMEMLSKMQEELVAEGESQQKAYEKFSDMCSDRSMELQHEVKVAKQQMQDLKATIEKAMNDEEESTAQIGELAGSLSASSSDLKAATLIREKEAAEFRETQKDFLDSISTMERAIGILEREYKQASFAQMPADMVAVQHQRAADLAQALSTIVDASFINSADSSSLAALIQTSEDEMDASDAADAQLDAAVDSYRGKTSSKGSGGSGILDVLNGLLEKAQAQLQGARKSETTSSHNFELFKASLEDKIKVGTARMNAQKADKAEAGQTRATATGRFEIVRKDLGEDRKGLEELHHECMTRSANFEDETKGRDAESKALATAKKILKEMTGGAEEAAYTQVSFMQLKSERSSRMPPSMEAAEMVRQLGQMQNMPALMQLSNKLEAVVRNSMVAGLDPFKKVNSMINTMLTRLTKQMEEEASHKAYCDHEMSETKKNQESKTSIVQKLTTRIDNQNSDSMNLKEQVAELQKELLANSKAQGEINRIRREERALYEKTKPELEMGLDGVKKALRVLREYYSQDEDSDKSTGQSRSGSTGVINMLEIVESDFTKNLAGLQAEEETAQRAYEEETKENELSNAIKSKEVVGKTREGKVLDKATSESSADRDGVQTELDAINEYFGKIQMECIAKPEPYEERLKRQQKTVQGLKEAAEVLEGRAVFLQQGSVGFHHARFLRGSNGGDEQDVDI